MIIQDIIKEADLPEDIKDFLIDNSDGIQEAIEEVEEKIYSMDVKTINDIVKEKINPLYDINTDFISSLSVGEAFKFEEWEGLVNLTLEDLTYNDLSYKYIKLIDNNIEHCKVEEYLLSLLTQEHYDAIELMEGI